MTDRELLELAAKAGGVIGEYESWTGQGFKEGIRQVLNGAKCLRPWNPRTDDGDGARLEAALGLDVAWHHMGVVVTYRSSEGHDVFGCDQICREPYADHGGDKQAARRMASLRLAAEVGKAMQQEHRRTTP